MRISWVLEIYTDVLTAKGRYVQNLGQTVQVRKNIVCLYTHTYNDKIHVVSITVKEPG